MNITNCHSKDITDGTFCDGDNCGPLYFCFETIFKIILKSNKFHDRLKMENRMNKMVSGI